MRKTSCIFIIFFLTIQAYAQQEKKLPKNKKDGITKKIEEINSMLSYYGTLSPFSENDNRSEIIDSVGKGIATRLLEILNDRRIINYPLEALLNRDQISVSKSIDNKVFFFSIDEKTGGSYRTNITLIHYRLPDGKVKAEYFGGEASEALGTSSYGTVYMLDSTNRKYFVTGSVQTCNTCNASFAITIQLDTNSYHTALVAQYDGRYHDLKVFDYDSTAKVFSYEFYAAHNDDSLYGGDNDKDQLQHKYRSKFKFLDGEFLEIERCETWDKID